jgi:hypothetical protein
MMTFCTARQHHLLAFISYWLLNTTALAVLPPTIDMQPTDSVSGGEQITLTATGGKPPYLWVTEAGELEPTTEDGNQAILTAPKVAGDFYIKLQDSLGTPTSAQFQVSWLHFSVTPEYVYLEPSQTINFGLHGVTGEFQVDLTENVGNWKPLPEKSGPGIQYTAPENPGFYGITFYQTNEPNDIRTAHVKVYPPLEAVTTEVVLEDYETKILEVKGGVPPYLWIEGGKGQLESLGTNRAQMRYIPGDIIGPETLTVYDNTGASVDIQVTVKGAFRVSPQQHSTCLDKAIVKIWSSGGQPPYRIEPPSQSGWQKIAQTDESLTLQFTQADHFEVVVSDQAGTTPKIAAVTVESCTDEKGLRMEPVGPIYEYVYPHQSPQQHAVTVSVNGPTSGQAEWRCQGPCTQEVFAQTKGKLTTFFPPDIGHYELIADDQAGNQGIIEVHLARDLVTLYAGADGKIDAIEMQAALDYYFSPGFCCTKTEFYQLIQYFINNKNPQFLPLK